MNSSAGGGDEKAHTEHQVNDNGVMSALMARPRTIAPNGEVSKLTVRLSDKARKRLERQAKQRGVTLAEVVRQALESAA